MTTVSRNDLSKIVDCCSESNLLSKKEMTKDFIMLMLARSQDIFVYKNLPKTIQDYVIERGLQIAGHVTFFKDNNNLLRVDVGNLGGVLNADYEYTQSTVANPFLEVNKTFYNQDVNTNKKDCVIVRNDAYFNDLGSLFRRNAVLESEAYLTMQFQMIYGRLPIVLTVQDEQQKKAFDKLIEQVVKGESITAMLDTKLFEGMHSVNALNIAKPDDLISLMELSNYFKAKSYNDIGLNANFNMKREAINESESSMNKDALIPYIQQMLKWRKKGIEEVNSFFGTNIEVELNELWQVKTDEVTKDIELIDSETSENENKTDTSEVTDNEKI